MTTNLPANKILIIEDNKKVSSLLKTSLEARSFEITIIDDGIRAIKTLETLKKDSYDLVLLDIHLPGATGWEILAKIRSLPETESYPVIILTALDDDSSEARALYDGADDYVTKPFSMKVLLARIEANIRKQDSASTVKIELPYTDGKFEELSARELEILKYIVKGYGTKEIAEKAFISDKTVINHIKSIIKKLKVENRLQAAIMALKYNLVED
jgi:DNA-binding NarL/FixJ family response regulator